jgi:hypothetical protein
VKRILLLAGLGGSSVSAEGWSPSQQAVIDQVRRCNDGWIESIRHKAFERLTTVRPLHTRVRRHYTN